MEAPRILSKSQILALESSYLFLRTLPPLLLSFGNECVSPDTHAQLDSAIELAAKNESRLIAHFSEVQLAADRWQLGDTPQNTHGKGATL